MISTLVGALAFAAGLAAGLALRRPKSAVPPPVERVAPHPLPPSPKPREAVVLVCDVRPRDGEGFSVEILRFVADLQRVLAGIIMDEGGRVDRFSADRMTAVFDATKTAAALEAADRMSRNVDALSRRVAEGVAIGIGLHRGPLAEGEPESGDTFDVAARLQALTREMQVAILVSGDVLRRSPAGRDWLVPAGEMALDGGVVQLYTPKSDESAVQLELLELAARSSLVADVR